MKPLGDGHVLRSSTLSAIECLHYALSLPTSVVITGCESIQRLDQAIEAVETFAPMSQADIVALLTRTRDAAAAGEYEPFKTTEMFDGTAHISRVDGGRQDDLSASACLQRASSTAAATLEPQQRIPRAR